MFYQRVDSLLLENYDGFEKIFFVLQLWPESNFSSYLQERRRIK
jgi:hypothetical protein